VHFKTPRLDFSEKQQVQHFRYSYECSQFSTTRISNPAFRNEED